MEGNILDVVGREIVGIVCPVSICMLLVVLLVKELQVEVTDTILTSVASLVYSEDGTDSNWDKFLGALINAGVFILVITVVTFALVLLFYFRCTKCLRVYMAIGAFTVLAYMGGSVLVMLIQELDMAIDVITTSIILYNFAIVGVLAVFLSRMPILVTQGYLIMVGTLVAFWFVSLPEWTTWVLLVAISLYDVVAVLMPGGPLNLLVQLAMTRDEEIPALIYEARPIAATHGRSTLLMVRTMSTGGSEMEGSGSAEDVRRPVWKRSGVPEERTSPANHDVPSLLTPLLASEAEAEGLDTPQQVHNLNLETYASNGALLPSQAVTTPPGQEQMVSHYNMGDLNHNLASEHGRELQIFSERPDLACGMQEHNRMATNDNDAILSVGNVEDLDRDVQDADDGLGLGSSGAIKLGLGDFIFYSVLVGRAALYDMTTVYACYLAIISGLGATLGLLAVWRRALPALPISIALGVIFYFLTRLLMEPFVMQYGGNLLFI